MNSDGQAEISLVTGATGFVGGHLARMLRSNGARVRVLIRKPEAREEFEREGIDVCFGDVRDPADVQRAVEGVAYVYHIAALFRQASCPDQMFFEVNLEGTRNLLDCSIAAGVKRFVHCSTVGVLGDVDGPPANEECPYAPCDVYQRSKVEGEKLALEYFRAGRISGCVIRPGMIYGPGDVRFLKLFKAVARGVFFYIGPGDSMVHYVDVRDLCRAFILAMQRPNINGEVFTISGRDIMTLKQFVEIVAAEIGVKPPWLHLPLRPMQILGEICERICRPLGIEPPLYRRRVDFFAKNRHFDISKARRLLDYEPALSTREEVAETVKWYKQSGWI